MIKNTFQKYKKHYWLLYTALFCLMSFICFGHFLINGKTFVWQTDGFVQHYKGLLYFAKWMRAILRNLIYNHSLSAPTFSFSFGMGADLFTTLQYYVIGDPFCIFSVFVPSKYMLHYYTCMILLRLYLSGLSFSAYAHYMGKKTSATLAGSLTYVFCSYTFSLAVRHPYFANPMVFFPLLLLGVEKIRRENKPWLMIFMVAVSAVSNFYFFYMLVILVVCYVLLEAFLPYEKGTFKRKLITVLRIGGYSFTGVLLSAVLFLPVVLRFLSDARRESGYTFDFLYNIRYYEKFFGALITGEGAGSDTRIGVSAAALLALFLLFRKKGKNRLRLKAAFCLSLTAFLLPAAAYVGNGFSYVSNRWSWSFIFLMAYILTEIWPELFTLTKKEVIYLSLCLAVYFGICSLPYYNDLENFYSSFGIAAIALLVLSAGQAKEGSRPEQYKKKTELLFFSLLLSGMAGMAFYQFSTYQDNYISEFLEAGWLQEGLNLSEAAAVERIDKSDGFSRYTLAIRDSGGKIINTRNASILKGSHNTQYYWSLSNGAVTNLYNATLTSIPFIFKTWGFDSHTALEELCSTKYFVTKSKKDDCVPYGYKFRKNSGTTLTTPDNSHITYYVYENQHPLPLGYTYSSYLSEQQAEALTPLQRQEAMLQAVILDHSEDNSNAAISLTSTEPEYEIQCNSDNITLQGNSFVTTRSNQSVTLTLSGPADCETYLSVNNLRFTGVDLYTLYGEDTSTDPLNLYGKAEWERLAPQRQREIMLDHLRYDPPDKFTLSASAARKDGSTVSNHVKCHTSRYNWYNGRKDFLINLYYSQSPVAAVTLTFPERGIYTFDSIRILCQPMADYEKQVKTLGKDVLENIDLHENSIYATNLVTGTIHLEESKYLVLSIPYSSGWTAYVDGKETGILKANYAFMALDLDAGDHEIKLYYHTPGIKAGFCISLTGLLCVIIIACVRLLPYRPR